MMLLKEYDHWAQDTLTTQRSIFIKNTHLRINQQYSRVFFCADCGIPLIFHTNNLNIYFCYICGTNFISSGNGHVLHKVYFDREDITDPDVTDLLHDYIRPCNYFIISHDPTKFNNSVMHTTNTNLHDVFETNHEYDYTKYQENTLSYAIKPNRT